MPRHPEPWYRSRDDAWYVQVNKRQVFLAHGKASKTEAYEAYHRLMATEGRTPPKDMRLADLCVLFREWVRENRAPSTWEWYRGHLQSFIDHMLQVAPSRLMATAEGISHASPHAISSH